MSENKNYQLHAYIKGLVQGVGFRYHTLKSAQEYNLKGWVRNLYDGRVEVVAEGEHENLNLLLSDLRKGPMSADVKDIDYEFTDATGKFDRFYVRNTA